MNAAQMNKGELKWESKWWWWGNVGGDICIRYKIMTRPFRRQTISRYSSKTNVNQQGGKKIHPPCSPGEAYKGLKSFFWESKINQLNKISGQQL